MPQPTKQETPHGVFHLGDCIKHLEALEPDGKRFVFTDPPWGNNAEIPGKRQREIRRKYDRTYKKVTWNTAPGEDLFSIMGKFPHLCFGGNYLFPQLQEGSLEFEIPTRAKMGEFIKNNPKNWIIWDKKKPEILTFSSFELIYASSELGIDTNVIPYLWNGLIKEGHETKYRMRQHHPCQKPPGLLMRIIMNHIPEGTTIIDPFAGSGSLAIAVLKLVKLGMDYRYLCIEKDEDYFRDAIKWVGDEVAAVSLFRRV